MVSVIVPSFNAEHTIRDCLYSICVQTYKDIEIIIINDGSTDNTSEICHSISEEDNRICVIDLPQNTGLPHARDVGIKAAHGIYIVFVDSDDYIGKESISVFLRKIGEADLVVGNYCVMNSFECISKSNITKDEIITNDKLLNSLFLDYDYSYQGYRWNKMFKKEIIDKCYFNYDELSYNEDRLFVCLYLTKCKKVKMITDVVYYYNQVYGSMTHKKDFNYELLTGLETFCIMERELFHYYHYAYCMCVLNAYYSADSLYQKVPIDDVNTRTYLRNYMTQHLSNFMLNAEKSIFFDKIMKVNENEKKYQGA